MDEKTELKLIGERIRAIRIERGMTQTELAFAAHISPSNISDIELGKTKIWLTTFCKLIEALQVSADAILRRNVPEVNVIYQKEYAALLSDCTPAEIESIMKIAREVKATLHSKKDEYDD